MRVPVRGWLIILVAAVAFLGAIPASAAPQASDTTTITNFDSAGNQVVRLDTRGNAVDAHDGEIAFFNGTYYLYGTSYDCGYQWQAGGTPFCGFKVYSSTDLVHWADRGYLFDPTTSAWQTACNGSTYGCFRPHVIYNASTGQYVLWINVYDNSVGYRVFTASSPTGPFTEAPTPTLAVNNSAPSGGVNNGDEGLFVDDDGTAYIAYTDWHTGGGDIVVERLSSSYLTGTGAYTRLGQSSTEAPALFKRGSTYYLSYSDPNCGYCGGTGTAYKTASSPLGPWSAGTSITSNSCGGQPSFVSAIPTTSGTAYLYGSDLWNNGRANEALANYFWTPLTFNADGSIQPITCSPSVSLALATGQAGGQQSSPDTDQTSGVSDFRSWCDMGGSIERIQTFVAGRTGTLTSVSGALFQNGATAGLEMDIYAASGSFQPTGSALYSTVVPAYSVGWSPRAVTIYPNIPVTAGTRYGVVLKSATTSGCYGMVYNESAPYPGGGEAYSSNSGSSFSVETNRSLNFATTVSSRATLSASTLPAGWTQCAGEHGTCTATAPGMMAFGAPGGYVYQSVAAGVVPCTVAAFGTDPDYGTLKSCSLAPQGGPGGYTFCASEGGTCPVQGTHTVAFGLNGAYSYLSATGSVSCSDSAFGDPLYSVVKSCYVSSS